MSLRRCAGCQADTPAGDMIAGLCPTCFTDGKPLPIGGLEPLTTRTLVRVGRGMRDTVKPDVTRCTELHHREEVKPMAGDTKSCRYCGKVMPKGSLFRHEHVMCEKRPPDGGDSTAGRRAAAKSKPAKVDVVARPSSGPEPLVKTVATVATNGHCADCLFRDLGRYIEQDLVRRAVVGGMALDAACAFVRDAKVAFGQ